MFGGMVCVPASLKVNKEADKGKPDDMKKPGIKEEADDDEDEEEEQSGTPEGVEERPDTEEGIKRSPSFSFSFLT